MATIQKIFVSPLGADELERIEREYEGGIPVRSIVEIFRPKGVRLSEATFRKYVQAGLLPRSRRVGRKGKHRGSRGLYPVEAVRRTNAIKRMMAEGMTLEDIKSSFVFFRNHIDQVERGLVEVFDAYHQQIVQKPFGKDRKQQLEAELTQLRDRTLSLLQDVSRLGSAVTVRSEHAASNSAVR